VSNLPQPRRGEIWLVGLDQTVGSEIAKTRPAVVASSDCVGILDVKLVVPLTGWKPEFERCVWHVQVVPDKVNGLDKVDSADALQTRCVARERFILRKGRVSATVLEEIAAAIAVVVEYQ
jgi:mRNA interferase MazF